MPELPPFPPWSGRKGVFKSQGYHSSPPNETELHRRLEPYLPDERQAFKDYEDLSRLAYAVGRPDISAPLESMAEDEHRHALNIQAMMGDLRWT